MDEFRNSFQILSNVLLPLLKRGEGAEGGLPLQFWFIPRREGKHEMKMIFFFNPNEGKTEFLI